MRDINRLAMKALIVTLLVGCGLIINVTSAMAEDKGKCKKGEKCYLTQEHFDYLNRKLQLLDDVSDTKAPKGRMHGLTWDQYKLTPWAGWHWGISAEVLGNLNIYGTKDDFAVPLRLSPYFRGIEPKSHLGFEFLGSVGGYFTPDMNDGDPVYPFTTSLRISAMAAGKYWGVLVGPEIIFLQGANQGTADRLVTPLVFGGEFREKNFALRFNLAWSLYSEDPAHEGLWLGLMLGWSSQEN